MTRQARRFSKDGFSLIEVMVGMTMLTGAMLGLTAAASTGIRQTTRAREDSQEWADAQQFIDSVVAVGFGNVASRTNEAVSVRGRTIRWDATAPTSSPQTLTFRVSRNSYQTLRGSATRYGAATDTIIVFLSSGTPGA